MHLHSILVILGLRQWFIPVFNRPSLLVAMTCSKLGGPLGGSQLEVVLSFNDCVSLYGPIWLSTVSMGGFLFSQHCINSDLWIYGTDADHGIYRPC